MRVTRLDSCGVPAWGDKTTAATEGFVSVAVTANYDDGDEISVTNANGRKCVQKDAESELTNLSIDAVFCEVDPELYTAWTGMPPIIDPATGDTIGFKINRGVRPNDVRNALEVWSNAQGTAPCADDGGVPFGYLLWPFMSGAKVSDYTIENNAVTFTVSGAITKDGSGWGFGPYDVATNALGAAAALQEAIDALDHQIVFRTTVAPPEPTNGLVPLDDPDNPDATGATAGIPGSFTPAGGVRPYDLAALVAADLDASPTTAWTTGQHIILGDGSLAHWSATAWVAGKA